MIKPLLPEAQEHLGNNGVPMPKDEVTPPCVVCGKENMGMHSIGYVMLRGAFVYPPELAVEVFNIDGDIPLQPLQMPDGTYGLVLEVNHHKKNAFVMHEECAEALVELIRNS